MEPTKREDTMAPVLGVVAAWMEAERRGDAAAVRGFLADDFAGVGPLGFVLPREAWLQRIESGALRYDDVAWNEATARVYGAAAVVIGRQRSRASYQGRPFGGEFRATVVAVRQGDGWRVAGIHYSPIAPPPGTEAAGPGGASGAEAG